MVSITVEQFERLSAFEGYGNPNGRSWFVGMEEGLERGGDLAREIRLRATWDAVEEFTARERASASGCTDSTQPGTRCRGLR